MRVSECAVLAALAIAYGSANAQSTQSQSQSQSATLPAQPLAQAEARTAQARPSPSVNLAFFDGANVPVDLLQAFDAVVVDPSRGFDPSANSLRHTVWLARTRADAAASTPSAFVASAIEPLWQRGYRGFLLDTPQALASIDAIRAAHPDARVVIGGDDVLKLAMPHAKGLYAVVGRSSFPRTTVRRASPLRKRLCGRRACPSCRSNIAPPMTARARARRPRKWWRRASRPT
jgi:hypothetical protein